MHLTDHHKAMLSRLLQGESWKVVMHVIGERLVSLEAIIRQPGASREQRLDHVERRNELLDMVGRLYQGAGEENPYNAAGGVLWATRMKLPEPEPIDQTAVQQEIAQEVLRRRNAGSIA